MTDRKKATGQALSRFQQRFEKGFGGESLRRGVDGAVAYEVIPTGSLDLDLALGCGGWLCGRIAELWGPDDAGKTTLAARSITEAQRAFPDQAAAFVDMERKLDQPWFALHGVDLGALHIVEPDSSEDVADAVRLMADSGLFSIIVVDSVGAMIPKALFDKDASEEARVGEQAKIVQRMVHINNTVCSRTGTAVLLINQVRANITKFGADTTTPGGWALKHGTSQKVHLRRGKPISMKLGNEDVEVGLEVAARVDRNKVAPPKKTAHFTLFHTPTAKYGPVGIDTVDEAVRLGIKLGIIERPSGSYYVLPGETVADKIRGEEKVKERLYKEPEMVEHIRTAVLATVADEVHEEADLVESE